jgi:hypothetical protein
VTPPPRLFLDDFSREKHQVRHISSDFEEDSAKDHFARRLVASFTVATQHCRPWSLIPYLVHVSSSIKLTPSQELFGRHSSRQVELANSPLTTPGTSLPVQHCSSPWQAENMATNATILRRRISRSCSLPRTARLFEAVFCHDFLLRAPARDDRCPSGTHGSATPVTGVACLGTSFLVASRPTASVVPIEPCCIGASCVAGVYLKVVSRQPICRGLFCHAPRRLGRRTVPRRKGPGQVRARHACPRNRNIHGYRHNNNGGSITPETSTGLGGLHSSEGATLRRPGSALGVEG